MQTYEGYWENGNFYHHMGAAVRVPGRRRAFVTVLDEPEKPSKNDDDNAFWMEFDRITAESAGENDLLLDEAFARRPSGREPVVFDDEGEA